MSSETMDSLTEDAFQQEFDEAWALIEQSQQTAAASAEEESAPQPEPTPEEAARIQARPRRTPRRVRVPGAIASQSSSSSLRPPPHQPSSNLTNASSASQSSSQAINPEVLAKIEETIQASFDAKLAAERLKWDAEKKDAVRIAEQGIEARMDGEKQASFAKGEEAAIAAHGDRWKSMEAQLAKDKKELQTREEKLGKEKARLEGLEKDRTDVLQAKVASQAKTITTQGEELQRLKTKGSAFVDQLQRQLADKDNQIQRGQAQVAAHAASIQQQVDQKTASFRSQIEAQLRKRQDFMRANFRVQLRSELFRELQKRSRASAEMDAKFNKSMSGSSGFHIDGRVTAKSNAHSIDRRFRQKLARQRATKKRLQRSHVVLKARNESLRQEDHRTIQALKDQARELTEERGGLTKTKKAVEAALAKKTEDCGNLSKKVRVLDASCRQAERTLEMANEKIVAGKAEARSLREANRALEGNTQKLAELDAALVRSKAAEASLAQKTEDYESLSKQVKELDASYRQSERTLKVAREEVVAGEAEARSLRKANQALEGSNKKLAEQSRSTNADLNIALAELNWRRADSEWMTSELEKVAGLLANCELLVEKRAEETRELEALVNERVEVWEDCEEAAGGREMDAPLGVPEKAKEGLLRPQFPHWKEILFWLMMGLFLGMLVVSYSAVAAANREKQTRLEVTRRAVLALHRGGGWQDLLLELSRNV